MKIKTVSQATTAVKNDAIIIYCYEGIKSLEGELADLDKALNSVISQLVRQKEITGKAGEINLVHSLGKLPSPRVVIYGLGKKSALSPDKIRGAVAETCRWLRKKGVSSIATSLPGTGTNNITPESAARAIAEGALLGLYSFRKYLSKKNDGRKEIKQLIVAVGRKEKSQAVKGIQEGVITAEAANMARDMVNEPANYMTPTQMATAARELAQVYGLEIEILEREQMQQLGMGGLLGVSQGSQQPPKLIILRYQGSSSPKIDLALVGKGITFDSGGISIKPSEKMSEMKGDMAGGAAVMAVISAAARLKLKLNITAIIPATENLPSGSALKPGDIIKAMNGKTIEVLNTDAEGRLILADALSYANKLGAKTIIDVATLTGACTVALGLICTGAFSNNQRLTDKVVAAGKSAGEYIWQMPMFDDYKEMIKSDLADIKNIGNRYGGAITAAKFLEEFVAKTPWVHLDIAGTFLSDKERNYLVKGATGVPVRTLINLIMTIAR
ncbi:leucyl aminopeptidase [Chloroflexota bacterium]